MVIQARKRFVVGLVAALFLAWFVVSASAQMIPSGCKDLTPSDWEWWFRQCYLYTVSDRDPARVTGFVVR
jgi:hypothetical protein